MLKRSRVFYPFARRLYLRRKILHARAQCGANFARCILLAAQRELVEYLKSL